MLKKGISIIFKRIKMTKKAIVFDSGPLISFSMNGLLELFRKLKEKFDGKFLITKEVKSEIIDRPIKIKRFEFEALKLKELIDEGVLSFPGAFGIKDNNVSEKTNEFLNKANKVFHSSQGHVKLIDKGEASCIALSSILNEKGIKNVLAIDERTTRMLIEDLKSTQKYLRKKLHIDVSMEKENARVFKDFKVIRSPELIYVAYKKDLIKMKDSMTLDAMLYAVKYKGAAISREEIEEIKKLG